MKIHVLRVGTVKKLKAEKGDIKKAISSSSVAKWSLEALELR